MKGSKRLEFARFGHAGDSVEREPLRLARLSEAEWLFLRSLRGWSQRGEGWCEVWNEHAKRFGSADGRVLLHLFCACRKAVGLAAVRPIIHHPPCCPYLAPDEQRITALLCAMALNRRDSALFTAHLLMKRDLIPDALDAVAKLASAYAARGLTISLRSPLARFTPKVAGTA